jgi:catechol 2,3-dioxygenase-like lactoylglutathione lyase family enzyme
VKSSNDSDFDYGAPPRGGWAKLVPELLVNDLAASRDFWTQVLGFEIAYQRPGFAYLERREGCQIMLCERSPKWETAPLEAPFGRGVLLQVFVDRVDDVLSKLLAVGHPLYVEPRDTWRRWGDREGGKREIVVQDPDGYLVMLAEDLGERPLGP